MSARDTFAKYGLEINAHDFDRLAPLISSECTFWFSSGTHRGIDQARRAFERTWSKIEKEVYSLSDVDWIAESGGAAVCIYTFHWEGIVDGQRREGTGRGTSCLRKETDTWRIVHEHLSPSPA